MNLLATTRTAACLLGCMLALPALAAEGNWHRDIDEALAQAVKEDKLIFMDIYADWCGPCRMMDQQTFSDERVQKRLDDYVMIKVDADVNTKVAARYGTGSLPTLVAIMPDGSPIATDPGFHGPDAFLGWLDKAESQVASFRALESKWKSDPENLETAVALGRQYLMMGRADDGLPVLRTVQAKAEAATDAESRAQFRYLLGVTLLTDDQFDAGADIFEGYAETFPNDPRAETATRLISEGRFLAAVAEMEDDNFADARTRFGVLAKSEAYPDIATEAEKRLGLLQLLGNDAPGLTVSEWVNGDPVTLESLEGKVVLVDFFQIICPGCKRAKPLIEAMQKAYGDQGLAVVGVAVAFEEEAHQQPEQIRSYVETTGYDWPVGIDQDLKATFADFRAQGSPWTVLIDRSGTVRYASFFNEDDIADRIEDLLEEPV